MLTSKSQEETTQIAASLVDKVKNGAVLCLYGDLGSGKTFFTKALLSELGLNEAEIKSPTYTYIREHKAGVIKIFHIDLYRLEEIDALLLQEIEEILEKPRNLVIIEWADKLGSHLPENRIDIHIKYLSPTSRSIDIHENRAD